MPEKGFDTSELDALARSLQAAPSRVIPALVPTAHRAGMAIKARMKKDAKGHNHLKGLPRTVEYDIFVAPTALVIDVGFRKEGQGNLAHFAAFGTSDQAPVMDITAGLYEELPRFMKWAAKIGSEAI